LPSPSPTTPPGKHQHGASPHRSLRGPGDTLASASLGEIWQYLAAAFDSIPAVAAEITTLRARADGARLDRANLAAAALATIAAHHDGDHDPLCYLRDELRAQGYDPAGRGSR
jgi:hypothetical protein